MGGLNGTAVIEYGSLAGLTCDEIDKGRNATRRYVLAHHTAGAVAKNASALLNVIQQENDHPAFPGNEISREKLKLTSKQRGPSR